MSPTITVINKLYRIEVLSNHSEFDTISDKYEISVVAVFIPKKLDKLTPQIYQSSSRYILTPPDSGGDRALFPLQSQVYPTNDNMPILEYIDSNSFKDFRDYAVILMLKKAEEVAKEIDPNYTLDY